MSEGEQLPAAEFLSQLEELADSQAKQFAHTEYGIPKRGIRVILCPGHKFICAVTRGPTAVIRLGILPWHPEFKRVFKNAIWQVYHYKMWESLEVELVATILRREDQIKRNVWRTYQFDPGMLTGMPKPEEINVKIMTRVEAVHRVTKLREVVEVDSASVFGAIELVKARLARRVAEQMQIEKIREMQEVKEIHPWDLPVDDPEWVANTN